MHVRNSMNFLSKLRALCVVLGVCLLALTGCKSQTSDQDQGPGPTENARKSGAAEQASKAALVGPWRMSSQTHKVGGLRDVEVDLLNGFDEIVRAGFEFRDNGEFVVMARLADNELQSKDGTWELGSVELKRFAVHLDYTDESEPQTLIIEPRADGDLDAQIQEQPFVLRKGPLEDYLNISDK